MKIDSTSQAALLEGLLQHYSPTGAELPASQYLAGQMQNLGFSGVEIDSAGSVVGSAGSGPDEIVLLGHIDTVPGRIPVRREGDLLYGRGAVDAKGPLACFVAAAAQFAVPPGWRITVIGAAGEEGDSRGAKLIRGRFHPTCCIIGEPSGWDRLTLAYKGSAWLEYAVTRPMAHTAARSESACEAAVSFWNRVQSRLEEWNQGRPRAFDCLTASLRHMESGPGQSGHRMEETGLSETARLRFNLRLPPGLTGPEAIELVQELAEDGQVHVLDLVECYRAGKNTPLVRAFLAAIRQHNGAPSFLVKTGTSDMNIVGPAWNIPILAYGPGDSALDHTPNEHISIPEYLQSVKVLHQALELLTTQT